MNALLLVPALPIAGALFLAFFGRRIPRAAGWIASFACLASFCTAAPIAWRGIHGVETAVTAWTFVASPALALDVAFRVDALSGVMLFVVLGVGTLIHFYSIEYMAHDKGVARFFAYLNMFVSFMLLLVLGDNLFLLFVGWEGVGLASYCLIGFWYEEDAPPRAGMKAFITNRIGDFGFMLGILILAWLTGTVQFGDVAQLIPRLAGERFAILGLSFPLIDLIALLLFIGACGKSAQFPLHVWLPDAMEGPTPVSALIHAATMVTAGIYMVARLDPLFAAAEQAREIMLAVAVLTALGAAITACAQTDLKRILAWSTISQLGYMMAGAAAGNRGAAVFHLATHAVFKALLFLAAGSVMHALHGKLDIRDMGGLIRRIPATGVALIVGSAGLAGIPLFAGYYSKDMILAVVAHEHPVMGVLLLLGALITAFYSMRMILVTLFGPERLDRHTAEHCHESGPLIIGVLGILALGTLLVGHAHVPAWLGAGEEHHGGWVLYAAWTSVAAGLFAGYVRYRNTVPRSTPWAEFIKSGFGLDDLYARIVIRPFISFGNWARDVVDGAGIDASASGLANAMGAVGQTMRTIQEGGIATYLCYMIGGMIAVLWVIVR